jgi:hypothetical protein
VLLVQSVDTVGVPPTRVRLLAVITLVQLVESYCEANEVSPLVALILGVEREKDVV